MKKILAIFTLLAGVASAQSFIRTHTIVSDNSTFPSPANVEWMSGESVRFEITAKSGNFYIPLSNGVAPVLKMWSGNVITQLYAQKTGTIYSAGSGKLYVDLLANEANITPTGAYNYAVGIYDGTQYMGVVAQGRASIRGHPFGASVGYVGSFNAFPYVPSNDAAYLNAITNIVAGTNITVSRSGRQVTVNSSASGGGSGTFTNLQWGTNNNTAQALISAESNIVFRSAGGSNYAALAGNLTGDFTFNGAINANDNIEIANTKHLRFQDGGGTNTVHLAATAGRLIITGALDIVSGQAVPATINGSQIAVNSDVSLRLASNVWAAANSTTNYVRRTGDTMTSALKILRTNDIGLTFGAFGTRNSIFGVGQNDALGSGLTFVPHTANPGVPVWTLGGVYDVSSGVMYGTALRGSGLGEIDGTIGAGDFFRLEFIGADSVTQRMLTVSADALGVTGSSALLSVSNATFSGNGAGITGVTIASLANGSTILTNGGPVATNYLPRTGGTMSGPITNTAGYFGNGAGLTNLSMSSPSRVSVPVVWGGFRSQTTNSSVLPVRGFVGGDSLTATSALSLLSFVVSATNTAQEKFGVAEISWPMSAATGITVTTYFQTSANGMSLVFYNGVSNAVAYPIAGVAGTSTTNLAATGFLTTAVQGDSVQVTCFSTNISTNAASTVVNGISQKITVTK